MATQELLLEMAKDFDADFDSGVLYWVNPKRKKPAGTYKSIGKRYHVKYKNKEYLRYRIIYALYNGHWPFGEIDHIDGNPSNDAISNLRDVGRTDNAKNCKRRSDNKSGFSGVSMQKGRWRVSIGRKYLKSFDNFEDAVSYRKDIQKNLGYTERHGQ